ncbi:ABC transporter permease [Bacillus haynesii]|uniref:ABC transporter permease n=1 Tax=Bacillus haynesii TaxID=1925021 RepID=UPI00227F310B|nr:ABC transporter permease [Bacillus haynesii]MCY8400241.1 ABC transporter permease [Bacillus haynesii]
MMKIIQLIRGDMKQIRRDSMLAFYGLAPFLLIIVTAAVVPLSAELTEFNFTTYRHLIMSLAMLFIPLILGVMSGFILLDERDENMIQYFAVTPMSKRGYVMVRLILPMALTLCYSTLLFASGGLMAPDAAHLLFVLIMVMLEAPIYTLLLAAYASNKVEGLALMKGFSLLTLMPAAVYFIPLPWQLFGVFTPTYWTAKTYLAGTSHEGFVLVFGIIGVVLHMMILLFLYRRFLVKTDQ